MHSTSTAARRSAAVLVLGFTALYLATMYPSVAGGDAGELIAAGATLGVAHPPGYPLYTMLTAAATAVPIGSVAARANALTALLGALAAGLLAYTVIRSSGCWWAGALAATLFGCSPLVWLYATHAEVFSLNNALLAGQLALFASSDRSGGNRHTLAAALVFSLGLSNHHTSVLITGPVLVVMLARTARAWQKPRAALALAGCLVAGLLPYAYLPLADLGTSPIRWGETRQLDGLITHLLRRDYGTFQLASDQAASAQPLLVQLSYYAQNLARQLTMPGVVLALFGLGAALSDDGTRVFAATTLGAFATYLLVFHSLANLPLDQPLQHGVVARFWMAPNLIVCVWAGLGAARLAKPFPRIAMPVSVAAVVLLVAGRASAADHSADYRVHDYGSAILAAAPPNALILTRGDLVTNSTRYLHAAENVRPDVRILDLELLTFPWFNTQMQSRTGVTVPGTHYHPQYGYRIADLIAANIARRPVVICGGWKPGDDSALRSYVARPLGLCDHIVGRDAPFDLSTWTATSRAALPVLRNGLAPIPAEDSWEFVVWSEVLEAHNRRAYTLLMYGIQTDDPTALGAAAEALDALVVLSPAPLPAYYRNLGIARARLAQRDPSQAPLAARAFHKYLANVPVTDTDLPAIRQLVQQLEGVR